MWAQKIVFVKFLLNIFAKIDFNRRRKKCENREQSEDVEFLALMPILSVSRNTTFCAAVVFIIFFLLRKNFPQMPSSSKMKKNWRHMKALLDSQKFCFYRKQFEIWRQKFCFDPFLKFRNEQFNSMILFPFPVNWQNLIKKFILNLSSLLYLLPLKKFLWRKPSTSRNWSRPIVKILSKSVESVKLWQNFWFKLLGLCYCELSTFSKTNKYDQIKNPKMCSFNRFVSFRVKVNYFTKAWAQSCRVLLN